MGCDSIAAHSQLFMIRRTPLKRGKPPRKKTSARRLKQQIDLIVKELVHERDGQMCLRCKKTRENCVLQAAHVDGKGKYVRLRFEPDNILSLCYACHMHWAHKQPREFTDWFRENWPERNERLDSLKRNAEKVNLKELLAELKSCPENFA